MESTEERTAYRIGSWSSVSGGPSGCRAAYWALARRYLPIRASAFERYAESIGTAHERHELERIYERMSPANFSNDLLSHPGTLAVIPLVGTGWSDWGSPKRVFQSLAGSLDLDQLLARIREPRAMALAS